MQSSLPAWSTYTGTTLEARLFDVFDGSSEFENKEKQIFKLWGWGIFLYDDNGLYQSPSEQTH